MKKILFVVMSSLLLFSCFKSEENLKDKNRIFRNDEKYYVYYNGNIFEMPKDLYLTQNKKVEDYFTKGNLKSFKIDVLNKEELLGDLNKYFFDEIQYVTRDENVSNAKMIPVVTVDSKKRIDSVKFEQVIK